MTVHFDIPDKQAAEFEAHAQAYGLTVEQWLLQLGAKSVSSPTPDPPVRRRHISEVIRENMRDVPIEDLAALPSDGASQHDYYIYGLPKRDL